MSSFHSPTLTELEDCIRYGTYYYPAVRHYYRGAIVQCDHCLRTNLRACIGYQHIDLCLSCSQHLEMNMKYQNPPPISQTSIDSSTNPNSFGSL